MNNNWETLIKAIVPLSFLAIWALTSLFNRESKAIPPRNSGQSAQFGPRPGEPTMRWSPPSATAQASGVRRVPIGDDDILIIQNDPARPNRPGLARAPQTGGPRRAAIRSRTAATPIQKVETPAARQKLSGVSQNVNQQLATPVGMIPLTTIAPMVSSSGSDLASAPSSPSRTSAVVSFSTLIPLMHDTTRLREAFLINELLKPPLALRPRKGAVH